jgi:hypothetical protein
VAAWDSLTPDPGRDPQSTHAELQQLLDQPVDALAASRRPARHVWHLSVRAAPEDPVLSDEQWGQIARRMVAATGIVPADDDAGCRWAAVRHADDHIDIVATLVREDGRRPRLHNDAGRAQAEARLIEAEYGLKRLNAGDGTAAQRPTSAERHKAERQGRERTAREELRETVRRAVAGAAGEEEFFESSAALTERLLAAGDLGSGCTRKLERAEHNDDVTVLGCPALDDLGGDAATGGSLDFPRQAKTAFTYAGSGDSEISEELYSDTPANCPTAWGGSSTP